MKLKHIILSAAVIFLPMVGVRSAHAQTDEVEKANIPFDFYAGSQKLPAGTYYFALDLPNHLIMISNSAGQQLRFLMGVEAEDGGDVSALIFDHVSDSYFLKDFKSDLLDMSFDMKAERAEANDMASAQQVVVRTNHA
jgi:hypothetical protein